MNKIFISAVIGLSVLSGCSTIRTHSSLDQDTNKKLSTLNGGVMLKINKKRDLANAFGNADIYGGKVNAGYVELRYRGMNKDGQIILSLFDNSVSSTETTMTRYKPLMPQNDNSINVNINAIPNESSVMQGNAFVHNYKEEPTLTIENYTIEIIKASSSQIEYQIRENKEK
ncbi:MAG: hypothetical protein WCQ47_04640 [bacterium]